MQQVSVSLDSKNSHLSEKKQQKSLEFHLTLQESQGSYVFGGEGVALTAPKISPVIGCAYDGQPGDGVRILVLCDPQDMTWAWTDT